MTVLALLPPELTPERATVLADRSAVPDPSVLAEDEPTRTNARQDCAKILDNATEADAAAMAEFDEAALEQDRFFGVRRVVGEPGELFRSGVLLTCLDVLAELEHGGTDLTVEERTWLFRGAWTMTGEIGTHLPGQLTDIGPRRISGESCLTRWKLGHRLFFVLTQGLIIALGDLAAAVTTDATDRRTNALHACAELFLASAAALTYTADFAPAEYENRIRPAMMPPHVPPGFSGLDGRDHQVLIGLFRDLRPVFAGLRPDDPAATEFRTAAQRMFDAHVLVCDRFGGTEHPSLRMVADDPDSRRAAGRVVRKLADARDRMLQPANINVAVRRQERVVPGNRAGR